MILRTGLQATDQKVAQSLSIRIAQIEIHAATNSRLAPFQVFSIAAVFDFAIPPH